MLAVGAFGIASSAQGIPSSKPAPLGCLGSPFFHVLGIAVVAEKVDAAVGGFNAKPHARERMRPRLQGPVF